MPASHIQHVWKRLKMHIIIAIYSSNKGVLQVTIATSHVTYLTT